MPIFAPLALVRSNKHAPRATDIDQHTAVRRLNDRQTLTQRAQHLARPLIAGQLPHFAGLRLVGLAGSIRGRHKFGAAIAAAEKVSSWEVLLAKLRRHDGRRDVAKILDPLRPIAG
jgi:hypothetical protein